LLTQESNNKILGSCIIKHTAYLLTDPDSYRDYACRPSLRLRRKEGEKVIFPSFRFSGERDVERSNDRVSKIEAALALMQLIQFYIDLFYT
jgi:hypothetical protein